MERQSKTLLEVVEEVSPCDWRKDFGQQFFLATTAINDWLDVEKDIWEKDLLTIVPREKFGLYFLGKANYLLDEFHDFVPLTIEDWEEMQRGEDCFFCLAMEYYFNAINELLVNFDIEEDKDINKMFERWWFVVGDTGEMIDGDGKQARDFKSGKTEHKLTAIFNALSESGYLPADGDLQGWLWVCTGKMGTQPTEPLKWHGTPTELALMVGNVFGRKWAVTAAVFQYKAKNGEWKAPTQAYLAKQWNNSTIMGTDLMKILSPILKNT